MNLASSRDYDHGTIIRIWINKVLLLLNEHGDPSFLFANLSSYMYNIKNQLAKFEKNLSVHRFCFCGMTLISPDSAIWHKML